MQGNLKLNQIYKDKKGKEAKVEKISGVLMLVIREGDKIISTVQKKKIADCGFELVEEER